MHNERIMKIQGYIYNIFFSSSCLFIFFSHNCEANLDTPPLHKFTCSNHCIYIDTNREVTRLFFLFFFSHKRL